MNIDQQHSIEERFGSLALEWMPATRAVKLIPPENGCVGISSEQPVWRRRDTPHHGCGRDHMPLRHNPKRPESILRKEGTFAEQPCALACST
jgi:hypothetical protein